MRGLFIDRLRASTVSSSLATLNYPVANIIHPFFNKRFQSPQTSGTIRFDLASSYSINCFFFGGHTLNGLTIKLYSGASLVHTEVVSSFDDIGVVYFSTVNSVTRIDIDITSATALKLSSAGAGVYLQLPDPNSNWGVSYEDNSVVSESPDGQTMRSQVLPLREYSFDFTDMPLSTRLELDNAYLAIGVGYPFFMDFFEGNRDVLAPAYVKLAEAPSFPKNVTTYTTNFRLKEAR